MHFLKQAFVPHWDKKGNKASSDVSNHLQQKIWEKRTVGVVVFLSRCLLFKRTIHGKDAKVEVEDISQIRSGNQKLKSVIWFNFASRFSTFSCDTNVASNRLTEVYNACFPFTRTPMSSRCFEVAQKPGQCTEFFPQNKPHVSRFFQGKKSIV